MVRIICLHNNAGYLLSLSHKHKTHAHNSVQYMLSMMRKCIMVKAGEKGSQRTGRFIIFGVS